MNGRDDSRLIYSTELGLQGNQSLQRGAKKAKRQAKKGPPVAQPVPNDGVVRVRPEKSGRGGKTVTVIVGLPASDLKPVGKRLKQACGSGGATKNGQVEIQGDHVQACISFLEGEGYTVKRAGG